MVTPTHPPAAPPEHEPARAALALQAILAVIVAAIFAGFAIGAFVTGDGTLKHDLYNDVRAAFFAIVFFYFGSSAGSKAKDLLRRPGG